MTAQPTPVTLPPEPERKPEVRECGLAHVLYRPGYGYYSRHTPGGYSSSAARSFWFGGEASARKQQRELNAKLDRPEWRVVIYRRTETITSNVELALLPDPEPAPEPAPAPASHSKSGTRFVLWRVNDGYYKGLDRAGCDPKLTVGRPVFTGGVAQAVGWDTEEAARSALAYFRANGPKGAFDGFRVARDDWSEHTDRRDWVTLLFEPEPAPEPVPAAYYAIRSSGKDPADRWRYVVQELRSSCADRFTVDVDRIDPSFRFADAASARAVRNELVASCALQPGAAVVKVTPGAAARVEEVPDPVPVREFYAIRSTYRSPVTGEPHYIRRLRFGCEVDGSTPDPREVESSGAFVHEAAARVARDGLVRRGVLFAGSAVVRVTIAGDTVVVSECPEPAQSEPFYALRDDRDGVYLERGGEKLTERVWGWEPDKIESSARFATIAAAEAQRARLAAESQRHVRVVRVTPSHRVEPVA